MYACCFFFHTCFFFFHFFEKKKKRGKESYELKLIHKMETSDGEWNTLNSHQSYYHFDSSFSFHFTKRQRFLDNTNECMKQKNIELDRTLSFFEWMENIVNRWIGKISNQWVKMNVNRMGIKMETKCILWVRMNGMDFFFFFFLRWCNFFAHDKQQWMQWNKWHRRIAKHNVQRIGDFKWTERENKEIHKRLNMKSVDIWKAKNEIVKANEWLICLLNMYVLATEHNEFYEFWTNSN